VVRGRLILFAVLVLGAFAPASAAGQVMDWSPPLQLDPGSTSQFGGGSGIDCAGDQLCVATGGEGKILVSTDPTGGVAAWEEVAIEEASADDLTSISCSGVAFCAAVDDGGHLFTTAEPTAVGSWDRATVDPGVELTDISCPSISFCAAVDADGNVLVSSEPAGGPTAWDVASIATTGELRAISCSSTALCVIVHDEGIPDSRLLVSTDPLAGAGSWSDGGANLENAGYDVSCPSDSFCAVAYWHGVLVSDEPAGGADAWHSSHASEAWGGISCPSEGFCLAEVAGGGVLASRDPAAVTPTWKEFRTSATTLYSLRGVDCTSADFCAMIDADGSVYTSTAPDGEPEDWVRTPTGAQAPELDSVACPTATFCAATGTLGRLYTSADPTDPASWSVSDLGDSVSGISCLRQDWCVAEAGAASLLYSEEPEAGAGAWQTIERPLGGTFSCPSLALCAQLVWRDDLLETTPDPLAGRSSWSTADMEIPDNRVGPGFLSAVSCPSAELCLLGGGGGQLLASATPTAGREAWVRAWVVGGEVTGLDCPTTSFCAATSWTGTLAASTDPLGGPAAWTVSDSPESFFLGAVSCAADASLCVSIDRNGNAVSTATPLVASSHWGTLEKIDGVESLTDVSCAADGSLCAAVDDEGRVIVGTRHAQPEIPTEGGASGPPSAAPAVPLPSPRATPSASCPAPKKHRKGAKKHRTKKRGAAVGRARKVSNGGKRSTSRCSRRA
jgi:hypothetical protein